MKLSRKFETIATVGYSHGVNPKNENRAAHGGVCHLQARNGANGPVGRRVNSNGRHEEIGVSFPLSAEELARWESIAKASR